MGVLYDLAYLCFWVFVWPYGKGSRPVGGFEMFRVALYEVHTGPRRTLEVRRCTLIFINIVTQYLKVLMRVRYKRPVVFQFVLAEIVQPNVSFHYVVRLM